LNKDAADAMHAIGKVANDAGREMSTSLKNLDKSAQEAGKKAKNSDLQKNASNALNKLGKETDKAGVDFAAGVKSNQTLNDLGKNANKAGAAMETSMKKMGAQANAQLSKAEHSVKNNSEKKAAPHAK
jgi:hypothetical protein